MNITFTFANYFYCGHPAASADGATDEDKGYSLSDRAMFGSVGGRTTLAFNLATTPSAGWVMSS